MIRLLLVLALSGCTAIYISGTTAPTSIQTTDPINVLGSQPTTSADKASRGSAHGDIETSATAATPVTVAPVIPGK